MRAIGLGKDITFYEIQKKDELFSFLDTKIKNNDVDPEKEMDHNME